MDKYEDIINLPHHVSEVHPRMSIENRAAQFAPFSALTGYNEAVLETARLVDKKIELDDGLKLMINDKLNYLVNNFSNDILVSVTYFVPDNKKNGGSYIDVTDNIKKIDIYKKYLVLNNNIKISFDDIISISSDILKETL